MYRAPPGAAPLEDSLASCNKLYSRAMDLHVVGCSGGLAPGRHPSTYLVDGRLAVDAGAIASALDPHAQGAIAAVLLTHCHLDHVLGLPFCVTDRLDAGIRPLRVLAPAPVLDAILANLFSGPLWPDPRDWRVEREPIVRFEAIEPERPTAIDGYTVRAVPLHHTIPCFGYLIERGSASLFIAGDTSNAEQALAAARGADALTLEVSFPNALQAVATDSGHMTPQALADALPGLGRDTRLLATHLKPGHEASITRELERLEHRQITVIKDGERYRF
jgi:ribonuclease BN (tRNA processing enzyme)